MTVQMAKVLDIERAARRRLDDAAYSALRDIDCQYNRRTCTLTLRGRVASFYLKQVA